MNAIIKKMDPIGIGAIIGILVVGGWLAWLVRKDANRFKTGIPKSPSTEKLNTLVPHEDPTPISS
jgi:hypothetical protein